MIKKITNLLIGYLLIFIGYFIPKKEIYLFTGQHGKRVFDNSKYLFDFFIKQKNENIKIYWFYTEKNAELEKIPQIYRVKSHSLKGIVLALQAKAAFVSYTAADFGFIRFNKKTIFVQLWHGIPIKTIFYGIKNNTLKDILSYKRELSRYSYFIASSPLESKYLQEQLNFPESKILISGYPRNDILKKERHNNKKRIKNILFAPTFRDDGYSLIEYIISHSNEWALFLDFLKDNGITLIIRAHATEFFKKQKNDKHFYSKITKHPNVFFASSKQYPDVQQLMLKSDCLISDYSGIIADYLLMEKPIIRFVPDYKKYSRVRGLNNYPVYTGKFIYTIADIINELQKINKNPNTYNKLLHHSKTCLHDKKLASPQIYSWILKK